MYTVETYCLFCVSGQETRVMARLRADGFAPLAPQVVRWKPSEKGPRKSVTQLLPGYIFFDSAQTPNWTEIRKYDSVLRVLQYDDGQRALRGTDLSFVAWLKKYDGVLQVSQAVKVGTKLEFVDGPLKDLAGQIVKINKNRRMVQVALGDETNLLRTIWCSMEYIEENMGEIQRDAD